MEDVSVSLKFYARRLLAEAIRNRKKIPKPCVKCGNPKVHGHHYDYSKPLDVIWLCAICHLEEHRRIKAGFRPMPKTVKIKSPPMKYAVNPIEIMLLEGKTALEIKNSLGVSRNRVYQIRAKMEQRNARNNQETA